MPKGWTWDETLFAGTASFYTSGRLPYAAGMAQAVAEHLQLDGAGRLLDAGCGPGTVALRLAPVFAEVVGLDPDADMLAEAARAAQASGIGNARWVCRRAEALPAGLGTFAVASFAQSFHWMDRELVAAAVFAMLPPGGAVLQVNGPNLQPRSLPDESLPYPRPPQEAIGDLIRRYLGTERRAGQGVLRYSMPNDEAAVMEGAGFLPMTVVQVPGPDYFVRSTDELVAGVFSNSGSAPHLFAGRQEQFERQLRQLLSDASPAGLFAEPGGDTGLRFWRKP